MVTLIPIWARHYEEFWDSIKARNSWFIKLRYGAVIMLVIFLLVTNFLLHIKFSPVQISAIAIITLSIYLYNILLIRLRKYIKNSDTGFNPIHLSIIQMILDLTALTLLVYYTGGIESPLFLLFVFHMVIGSLILPKNVIYFAAGLVILIFSLLVFGEYFNAIPHHPISGFLVSPYYNNFSFISVFLIVYGFVLGVTVLLTNRIARELYKMEENLLDSLDKIKATEIEKENYITGVVHEIKTPISAVQSYLDLILQKYLGPLDSKIEEKLIRTRTRSDEAIQMINNILKISRLKLLDDLGKEELDINALICSALEKLNMHMEAKDINCTLNDNTKNKNKVAGDKFLMEIGFSNIISNAVKYCDKGGKLLISIKELGSGIEISFCDNGVGIPKEEIDNIFKEFYRGSNIKHKGYEGVGLGLSVVNQIINRHGGTIRVESPSRMADDTHPGTCFIIYLPVI